MFIDEQGLTKEFFSKKNYVVCLCNITSSKDFHVLAVDKIYDLHFTGDSQGIALYRYNLNGECVDNITNWGLQQFNDHYQSGKGDSNSHAATTKEDIFHYTYAVLHHPAYRKKCEINLKREFPRIPFYDDFPQWVK